MLRRFFPAPVLAVALALAGCGGSESDGRPDEAATLALDGPPAAIHAGIELAVSRAFTDAEGVQLTVAAPDAGGEGLSRLIAHQADFAVADLHAVARAANPDVVVVMAIVQDPIAAEAARAGVRHIAGAPPYPEVVLVTDKETLQDDPALVSATVHALQRGYRETIADPDSAVQALMTASAGADRARLTRQLAAVSPAFQADDGTIGTLNTGALARWARWEAARGIVARAPDVALLFDGRFARSGVKLTKQGDG